MSDARRAPAAPQMPVTVLSTFGTPFQIAAETAEDYLLHPVFLRFVMICLCIRALLEDGDDIRLLQGWQVAVLWLVVTMASVAALVTCLGLMRGVLRLGARRRFYTPFLLLPLILAAEYATQGVIAIFHDGYAKPVEAVLIDLARDMLVMVMFDALHALYVAPLHPLALAAEGDRAVAEEPRPEPPGMARDDGIDSSPDPAPLPEWDIAEIGDRRFALADLVSVRTEDHYLNVVTRTGRSLLRAKLSDVAALHSGRHGVQINRSQWVAFAAIVAVRDEGNGQIVLDLANGDSATVARSRRLAFRQLYQVAGREAG